MIKLKWCIAISFFAGYLSVNLSDETAHAQEDFKKWEKDIAKFEANDRKSPPKKKGVLFLGSSSIRMWDLEKSFPEKGYINRGFGGSQISDSIHFFNRLVVPYQPNTIVFYAGDNDIAKNKSPARVFNDFKKFVNLTREAFPKCKIVFVAIKPSIKRWAMVKKMREANSLIAKYASQNNLVEFADIDTPMIGKDGLPIKNLFADDGLHLNEQGYKVWNSVVRPLLNKPSKKE